MVRTMNLKASISPPGAAVPAMERPPTPVPDKAGRSFESAEDYGVPVPRIDGPGTVAGVPGSGLAAGSIVVDKCLARMFVAAYLLSGSAIDAERATLESIQQLDISAVPNGRLPWKAIATAVMRGIPDSEQTPGGAPPELPVELLRVLRLPPGLRRCYVLRLLMAMPRQYCADVLRIDAGEVDRNTCLAAQQLATIVAAETAS